MDAGGLLSLDTRLLLGKKHAAGVKVREDGCLIVDAAFYLSIFLNSRIIYCTALHLPDIYPTSIGAGIVSAALAPSFPKPLPLHLQQFWKLIPLQVSCKVFLETIAVGWPLCRQSLCPTCILQVFVLIFAS